jgi:hypothetical protein
MNGKGRKGGEGPPCDTDGVRCLPLDVRRGVQRGVAPEQATRLRIFHKCSGYDVALPARRHDDAMQVTSGRASLSTTCISMPVGACVAGVG